MVLFKKENTRKDITSLGNKNSITKVKNETETASFSAENPASESNNTDENLILTASIESEIEYSTPFNSEVTLLKKDIQTKNDYFNTM